MDTVTACAGSHVPANEDDDAGQSHSSTSIEGTQHLRKSDVKVTVSELHVSQEEGKRERRVTAAQMQEIVNPMKGSRVDDWVCSQAALGRQEPSSARCISDEEGAMGRGRDSKATAQLEDSTVSLQGSPDDDSVRPHSTFPCLLSLPPCSRVLL
eukprot:1889162-Rhodomonas_salina.2